MLGSLFFFNRALKIHASLYAGFANGSGKLSSIQFRKNQLLQLGYAFKDNIDRWQDALAKDMGRPKLEARMFVVVHIVCFHAKPKQGFTYRTDVSAMLSEVNFAYKNIKTWTKASGPTNWTLDWAPFSPTVRKQPAGVVLIITPFNFPLWTLAPLVSCFILFSLGCLMPGHFPDRLIYLMCVGFLLLMMPISSGRRYYGWLSHTHQAIRTHASHIISYGGDIPQVP